MCRPSKHGPAAQDAASPCVPGASKASPGHPPPSTVMADLSAGASKPAEGLPSPLPGSESAPAQLCTDVVGRSCAALPVSANSPETVETAEPEDQAAEMLCAESAKRSAPAARAGQNQNSLQRTQGKGKGKAALPRERGQRSMQMFFASKPST